MDDNTHWVGTWSASPAPSDAGIGFNNHTLRMNPRVSIGGDTLRVRVSNAYGSRNLEIGAACVAIRDKGPAIIPGSERAITFCGSRSATVAAGALIVRDSVKLDVCNDWIRESGAFAGVVDFDKALRDPGCPTRMLPIYDCGDGLHPSDLGYCKMGDAIDLALFDDA